MSGDALDSGGRQIIESILSDADAQARRLVENAESTASALRAKARKEGGRARDALLAKTTEQCGRIRAQGLATARIEAKRLLLAAREDLAGRFLEQIEEKLAATVRSSEAYSQSLWNLAAEAVTAIGLPIVLHKQHARSTRCPRLCDAPCARSLQIPLNSTKRTAELHRNRAAGSLPKQAMRATGASRDDRQGCNERPWLSTLSEPCGASLAP